MLLAPADNPGGVVNLFPRAKARAMDRILREHRARLADEFARAIEGLTCDPAEHCADRWCPDCIRRIQSKADAALVRRLGGAAARAGADVSAPGRTGEPAGERTQDEPEPASVALSAAGLPSQTVAVHDQSGRTIWARLDGGVLTLADYPVAWRGGEP
jgi:hypothetical protein